MEGFRDDSVVSEVLPLVYNALESEHAMVSDLGFMWFASFS
jgi:hypothetical protein